MNEQQALEILAEMLNKASKQDVYNKSELFAIQQAFIKLQEKDENPDKKTG
jgi:hypothetical protein